MASTTPDKTRDCAARFLSVANAPFAGPASAQAAV
jgi:hypothetical protein